MKTENSDSSTAFKYKFLTILYTETTFWVRGKKDENFHLWKCLNQSTY